MINGKKVLAIIPARGGSKGIPRKNICSVGGRPLIAWTIEEARKSNFIDRLIISTEDEEIAETARRLGCDVPFLRPAQLAQDDTPGIDPVLHAISNLPEYEWIVLLQPTSPLRLAGDIDGAIRFMAEKAAPACVSVTEPEKSAYWMYSLDSAGRMSPLLKGDLIVRRQDLPATYALNGAVYVAGRDYLIKNRNFITAETVGYVMPKDRSLDLDTPLDLSILEALLKGRGTEHVE